MTELHIAAYEGDLSWVQDCLRRGDDIDARDDYGNTPLHWAADMAMTNGEPEAVVTALCEAGADVNARRDGGETVLMVACMAGNRDVMLRLISAGADVAAKNDRGEGALAYTTDPGLCALLTGTSHDPG